MDEAFAKSTFIVGNTTFAAWHQKPGEPVGGQCLVAKAAK
jgi:hypothetical protein